MSSLVAHAPRPASRAITIALLACTCALANVGAGCGSRKPAESPAGAGGAASAKEAPASVENTTGEGPPAAAAPGETTKLAGTSRELYDRGIAAYRAGDLALAAQSFDQAVAAEPKAFEAHFALAVTDEHLGKNAEALQHYREAFRLNPNFEAAIAGYAFLLYRTGSKAEAENFLADQSAKNPKAIGVMTALAEIKSLQGDSNGAQKLATEALTVDARYEPAMVMIARDHYRRGRVDLASYVLTAILDGQKTQEERDKGLPAKTNPPRAPNNPEAHFLRGMILHKQGERLGAAKWYDSASRLRGDLVDARLQLGLIRLEANDAEGALEPLQKATAYAPSSVEAHLGLGESLRLAGGRPLDAKREYVWVTSAPNASAQIKALAQYDLGLLYFLTPGVEGLADPQRLDRAIEYLNQYKAAKGAAAGPSWPADADDLIEQARRAKSAAAAGAAGAGGSAPKTGAPATSAPPPAGAPPKAGAPASTPPASAPKTGAPPPTPPGAASPPGATIPKGAPGGPGSNPRPASSGGVKSTF